ncbi:MAG: tyrosine-type recombinase/integrase [Actinomycetota bacterium]|jgi:site-specific recombinase XerD|nr:tyrosine-type recombinase/integrase [Actinomycetota bacterium]
MSDYYVGQHVPVRGPLAGMAERFAEVLWGRGYSTRTVDSHMRMLRDLSGWLDDRGIALSAVDDEVIETYVSQRRAQTRTLRSSRGMAALLGVLRDEGVVPTPSPKAVTPGSPTWILTEFEEYLRQVRGLSDATVASYCSQVHPLVRSVAEGTWASLTTERVRAFIDERAAGRPPRSVQVRINAVRALLRWLWSERLISVPLHEQVFSMYAPGGPPLPRGLSASEVTALYASLSADPAARLRDTALVALMLRLGLRAGEATLLVLEDLHWRAGTVTVAGKRGRIDEVPLPVDVGEALVAYLRRGRPVGTGHRHVFLSIDAPHVPIRATAVTTFVGDAMRRAGIAGPGAAHRLRHTAAMGVIAAGGGLVEAGQLLRHSTVSATGIYARADVSGLAVLARPWPGEKR